MMTAGPGSVASPPWEHCTVGSTLEGRWHHGHPQFADGGTEPKEAKRLDLDNALPAWRGQELNPMGPPEAAYKNTDAPYLH